MATHLVREGFQTDMTGIDFSVLFQGTPTVATKKMYVLEFGDGYVDFRGEDFKYTANGAPRSGTVEGYALYPGGEQGLSFGGFEVSVKAFVKAASTISTSDDQRLLADMLSGKDNVVGASLADGLAGYGGKDKLVGNGGADALWGGAGKDKFIYLDTSDSTLGEIDTIYGFARGDKIALSAIADYDFIGQTAFSGNGSEIAWTVLEGDTYVIADTDGDTMTDLAIKIEGSVNLTEADFLL